MASMDDSLRPVLDIIALNALPKFPSSILLALYRMPFRVRDNESADGSRVDFDREVFE